MDILSFLAGINVGIAIMTIIKLQRDNLIEKERNKRTQFTLELLHEYGKTKRRELE